MLYLKAWAYFLGPPNLLDLAIKREKIITKQKALATSETERKMLIRRPTFHSRNRWHSLQKKMEDFSDQIQRIKVKLSVAKRKDKKLRVFGSSSHKYQISTPVSVAEIKQFENKCNIKLPCCYRTFLIEVGNGGISYMKSGAGPYYGIFPLGKNIDDLVENAERHLSKDCVIHPELNDEEWTKLNKNIDSDNDISDEDFEIERSKIFGGILPIASQGCTYISGLILNGLQRGRILNLDFDFQKPSFAYESNFLDWYERWLDEVILGKLFESPSWFGYGKRESEHIPIDSPKLNIKRNFKFW